MLSKGSPGTTREDLGDYDVLILINTRTFLPIGGDSTSNENPPRNPHIRRGLFGAAARKREPGRGNMTRAGDDGKAEGEGAFPTSEPHKNMAEASLLSLHLPIIPRRFKLPPTRPPYPQQSLHGG